ncbi:uncharacterized protein ACB058_011889 isoform 3-T3 [Synchiropus picturatus]
MKTSWTFIRFLLFCLALEMPKTYSAPDFSLYLQSILRNHTAHACDGDTLSIECPSRSSVSVLSAFYGRRVPSEHLCPSVNHNLTTEDIECTTPVVIEKVLFECQDQQFCHIPVFSPVFGHDPCPHTSKYLLVSYKCRPECLSPSALRKVSRRCHGRSNCSLIADTQTFGDPCFPGTRKHLRVSFTCVPRYLLEEVGRGSTDPFMISDYTHGGWYTGPIYRPQNTLFTNSLELIEKMFGLPERVALYFVSGICAGLVFLLCLFGIRSTLVKDVKELVSDLSEELKASRRRRKETIVDLFDDDISDTSSFRRLTQTYREADTFTPSTLTVERLDGGVEQMRDLSNGDIWPHGDSSPYVIHHLKTSDN